jgi:dUTP pyrophosphatase
MKEPIMSIIVPIRVGPSGQTPCYSSPHAAGADLFAASDLVLTPGQTAILPLDFILALPEGYEAQVRPRSGLSVKTDLRVPNSPGTIDADYRNPVGLILQNTFNPAILATRIAAEPQMLASILATHRPIRLRDHLLAQGTPAEALADPALAGLLDTSLFLDAQGNPYGTLYLKQGERLAQLVVCRHERAEFIDHPDAASIGQDRGGGFGSTGL